MTDEDLALYASIAEDFIDTGLEVKGRSGTFHDIGITFEALLAEVRRLQAQVETAADILVDSEVADSHQEALTAISFVQRRKRPQNAK